MLPLQHVFLCVFIILTTLTPTIVSGDAHQNASETRRKARARLYTDLESSWILQNRLVPLSQSGPIEVNLGLNLYKVMQVHEAGQVLTAAFYVEMGWKDEDLSWNPKDYHNISTVFLPTHRIWYPVLRVLNTASETFEFLSIPDEVLVSHEGVFKITDGAVVHTHCHIDLKYYPLDHQNCTIMVVVAGFDVATTTKTYMSEMMPGVQELAMIPGEWIVASHKLVVVEAEGWSYITYTVELSRASSYYILCELVPMAATSQLTLLVFWIPPTAGERVSFLMSIYVSTTLYLGQVGDTLPRKKFSLFKAPRMVLFVIYNIFQCILVLVATIISMHLHEAEQKSGSENLQTEQNTQYLTSRTTSGDRMPKTRPQGTMPEKYETKERDHNLDDNIQAQASEKIKGPVLAWYPNDTIKREKAREEFIKTDAQQHSPNQGERIRSVLGRICSGKAYRISANVVDKVMFSMFMTCSIVFFCTIFNV